MSHGARATALLGPDAAVGSLLPEAGLVLEPDLDPLLRMRRKGLLNGLYEPPLLKAACAAGSALGCTGRGTRFEKPRRCRRKYVPEIE